MPISIEDGQARSSACCCSPTASPRSPRRPCPRSCRSSRTPASRCSCPPARWSSTRPCRPYSSSDGMELRPGGEDLILVLGGDGSILRALAREAGSGAPVIGVNYGRVGFLASIERETLERDLRRALAGEFVVLGLPSLKAEWGEGEVQAVNDLALFRGGESRIADLTYAVDGELVATVRCDGVVLSTPVGSTAYNLAAGGPTVSWRVRCFVLSFIALHHLDSRPLVIGAEESFAVTNSALVGDCEHPGRRPAHRRAAPRPLDHGRPERATRSTWRRSRRRRSSGATGRSSAGRDPRARGAGPRGDRAGRDRPAGRPDRDHRRDRGRQDRAGPGAGAAGRRARPTPARCGRGRATPSCRRRSPCPTGSGTGWTRTTRPRRCASWPRTRARS